MSKLIGIYQCWSKFKSDKVNPARISEPPKKKEVSTPKWFPPRIAAEKETSYWQSVTFGSGLFILILHLVFMEIVFDWMQLLPSAWSIRPLGISVLGVHLDTGIREVAEKKTYSTHCSMTSSKGGQCARRPQKPKWYDQRVFVLMKCACMISDYNRPVCVSPIHLAYNLCSGLLYISFTEYSVWLLLFMSGIWPANWCYLWRGPVHGVCLRSISTNFIWRVQRGVSIMPVLVHSAFASSSCIQFCSPPN